MKIKSYLSLIAEKYFTLLVWAVMNFLFISEIQNPDLGYVCAVISLAAFLIYDALMKIKFYLSVMIGWMTFFAKKEQSDD